MEKPITFIKTYCLTCHAFTWAVLREDSELLCLECMAEGRETPVGPHAVRHLVGIALDEGW